MANHWLQSKKYACLECGAIYLHDQAHRHAVFACPARKYGRQKSPASRDLGTAQPGPCPISRDWRGNPCNP